MSTFIAICIGISIGFVLAAALYALRHAKLKGIIIILLIASALGAIIYYGADVIGGYLKVDSVRFDGLPFSIDYCVVNALVFGLFAIAILWYIAFRFVIPVLIVGGICLVAGGWLINLLQESPVLATLALMVLCFVGALLLLNEARKARKAKKA